MCRDQSAGTVPESMGPRGCAPAGPPPGVSGEACAGERRRTGIEPARPGYRAAPVLKTGRGTSHLNASDRHPSRAGSVVVRVAAGGV